MCPHPHSASRCSSRPCLLHPLARCCVRLCISAGSAPEAELVGTVFPLCPCAPLDLSEEGEPSVTPGRLPCSADVAASRESFSTLDRVVEARPRAPSLEVEAQQGSAPSLVAREWSSMSPGYASSAPSVLMASLPPRSCVQPHGGLQAGRRIDGVEALASVPPERVGACSRSRAGVEAPASAPPLCGAAAPVVSPRLRVILERTAVRPRPTVCRISDAVSMPAHALGAKTETVRRIAIRAAVAADNARRCPACAGAEPGSVAIEVAGVPGPQAMMVGTPVGNSVMCG